MAFGTFVWFCHPHQDPEALGKRVPHPYMGIQRGLMGRGSQWVPPLWGPVLLQGTHPAGCGTSTATSQEMP